MATKFKMLVVIDFGTDFIKIACKLVNSKRIQHIYEFKSDILFNADGRCIAFGNDAMRLYEHCYESDSSSCDCDSSCDSNISHKTLPMFFQSIKMILYDNQTVSDNDTIKSVDGKTLKISKIFIQIFEKIKEKIFKSFNTNALSPIKSNDIQWILTVPSMWRENAKNKIKMWALTAKLIHVSIVYDIDCALLNHLINQNQNNDNNQVPDNISIDDIDEKKDDDLQNNKLLNSENANTYVNVGDKIIVIDAGADIVDIGCYQTLEQNASYSVQEIYPASSGQWGSNYVTNYFEELLNEIYGKDNISKFKQQYPQQFVSTKLYFKQAKKSFYQLQNKKYHSVQLNFDFIEFLDEMIEELNEKNRLKSAWICCDLGLFTHNTTPFGLSKVGHIIIDDNVLSISSRVWQQYLFNKVIDPMISHIQKLLNILSKRATNTINGFIRRIENILTYNRRIPLEIIQLCTLFCYPISNINHKIIPINYVYITGGFSQSKYFQFCIQKAFGLKSTYKIPIIKEKKPKLSVLHGALHLASNRHFVTGRYTKYTYGIAVDRSLKNVDIDRLPKNYISKHSYFNPWSHKKCVKSLFSALIHKNEFIKVDNVVEKKYKRFMINEKTVVISLYQSNLEDPYIVEGEPSARFLIEFDESYKSLTFIVQFYFGGTTLRVISMNKECVNL